MAITTENLYTGDGTTVLFSFTFPYISVGDVYVSVDGTDLTQITEYQFSNATTIEILSAPAVGSAVRVYRNTDVTDVKALFFPGSAIRARDLNDNFTQNLYVTQEATFESGAATDSAKAAQLAAEAAQASADAASSDASDAAAGVIEAQESAAAAQAAATAAQETADGIDADVSAIAEDAAEAQASASAAQASAAAAQAAAEAAEAAVQEGPVVSVNGQTGVVVLTTNDVVDLTTLPTLPSEE